MQIFQLTDYVSLYEGESKILCVTAHPAPASRQRPGAGQPQPAARQSSGGLLDITASMPLNQAPPPPPQARPTHRPQTRPLLGMIWLWYTQYSKLITCSYYVGEMTEVCNLIMIIISEC